MTTHRRFALTACLLAAVAVAAPPLSAAWPDPVDSPAELQARAAQSFMLDVATLPGGRLVAVGERGHILLSDDAGASWRQVAAPVRSTLTSVAASDTAAVAAGHDGVILRSTDLGETWQRVREERYSVDNQMSPSNGSPVLDLVFLDAQRVLAVGAYALMLRSDDGGASWQPLEADLTGGGSEDIDDTGMDDSGNDDAQDADALLFDDADLAIDDEVDPHLNAITRVGDALIMVGERGSAFRSRDDGETWQRLGLPYGGSMFGVLPLSGDSLLVYGLRGRIFQSDDAGDSWREIETGVTATLFGGDAADGGTVLVGAQGVVLRRAAGDGSFSSHVFTNADGETPIGAAVRLRDDGSLLLIGDRGITTWQEQP